MNPLNALDEILNLDPIQQLEDMGLEGNTAAMLFHALTVNQLKTEALKACGDTVYGHAVESYIQTAQGEGFETVLHIPFAREEGYYDVHRADGFFIMWNSLLGALLVFDTYGGNSVNSAILYYNIDFGVKPPSNYFHFTSSGGFTIVGERYIWAGRHDAREGLRNTLRKLRMVATLPEWKVCPFLWLLHHGDKAGDDVLNGHSSINEQRINMLPENVRKAISAPPSR